ncbi:HotDog domain-containing protein [Cunninghamella echinulata]|nr:HotDog domain-containing protein [Cunninghamella echinulata]
MPSSIFPAVISFSSQKDFERLQIDDSVDYGEYLAKSVDVQEIDVDLYMSQMLYIPLGGRGVFGGQIVAQALSAAFKTVGKTFQVHSLHSYFILPGDVSTPVLYDVFRLRDGRSFATRFIRAKQKGKAIFICSCSFTKDYEEPAINHQTKLPKVPEPETLPSAEDKMAEILASKDNLSPKYREYLQKQADEDRPVDYREINPDQITDDDPWFTSGAAQSRRARWFRTRGKLNDDPRLHACVIAYMSDSAFLITAAQASGIKRRGFGMVASIDHSIYFHKFGRADEWLLYDMFSPQAGEGRGLTFGRIYTKSGELIATTSQEGLIRLTKAEQQKVKDQLEANKKLNSKL